MLPIARHTRTSLELRDSFHDLINIQYQSNTLRRLPKKVYRPTLPGRKFETPRLLCRKFETPRQLCRKFETPRRRESLQKRDCETCKNKPKFCETQLLRWCKSFTGMSSTVKEPMIIGNIAATVRHRQSYTQWRICGPYLI